MEATRPADLRQAHPQEISTSPFQPPSPPRTVMLGLHRILGIRIVITEGGPVAEVIAVLHRRPVRSRLSLTTAAELAAAGVPLTVRRRVPAGAGLTTSRSTEATSGSR